METLAVIVTAPRELEVRRLPVSAEGDDVVVVDVDYSGISTGTERLLFTGEMPPFPGMGYPLVPGYESVGRVVEAGKDANLDVGDAVFVPGANCYGDVRGLFGGASSRIALPSSRARKLADASERWVLLALAATARHAIVGGPLPELIVGHGVLGRLIARQTVARGGSPVVWETNPARRDGADGYAVVDPSSDERRDYAAICDVSGDKNLLDTLIGRLAKGGEVVLAGFYPGALSFTFPMAFLKEARLRVAAEWAPEDLDEVMREIEAGAFSLDGLLTHRRAFDDAPAAYATAFEDPTCLKMTLDWSTSR